MTIPRFARDRSNGRCRAGHYHSTCIGRRRHALRYPPGSTYAASRDRQYQVYIFPDNLTTPSPAWMAS